MSSGPSHGQPTMTTLQPIASTPDLPRLRAFYETVLGATPATDEGFYVELRIGTSTLGLLQAELCGIFVSLYLRAIAKLGGYERLVRGRWMFYPGVMSK